MIVMTVRTSATHLYCFHVGCSCTSPIAWTSISGFVWVNWSCWAIKNQGRGERATAEREVSTLDAQPFTRLLDQIDQSEDCDPDDVDEVPVECGDVDQQCILGLQAAPDVDREQRKEPQ